MRLFQLHLMENGLSIQNRNRTMTGVRFLLRVTMRRHDLAAEVFHMKEPQKIPLILSAVEAKRLLTMAGKLQVRVLLSIGYGAGLRVSEVVKLKAKHIDSALGIIRVEQAKGKKDRNVMLSPETLELLRECQHRNLQVQGLPGGRRRTLQDHDTRYGRVHPAIPDACSAEGLPSHPALWAACQWRPR